MDLDHELINDKSYDTRNTKSLCRRGTILQHIIIIVVLALIAWLSVITWYLHDSSNNVNSVNAITATTVSLDVSHQGCAADIKADTPVSFSAVDGSIVVGAGTTAYVGAQHHNYGSYTPNHLNVVSLKGEFVLLGLGSFVIVGDGGADWVSGSFFPFDVSTNGSVPAGWSQFYELPLFVDEVVLLSCVDDVALLVATGGGGVIGMRVDLSSKSVTIGNHTSFVSGPSVDTDTTAIGPSTFAISYYYDAADGAILLMTIAGSLSDTLNVQFGDSINYSPNHMFHQIQPLGPNLYALAFPHDNMSALSSASPMGILIASVDSKNKITIWSADGAGTPWLQSHVLGYYFFDMILLDCLFEVDGITATGSMAVVNRNAADAITVITFRVTASGRANTGYSSVNCVFGSQLTVTQPGATIGYNYFAMQPLYSLVSPAVAMHHQRSLKSSISFTPASVKNDFAIVWQDTSKGGAVDAVIVSYALESGRLGLVMESTQVAPPIPKGDNSHWWIAGGAMPGHRMMILTALDSSGNITIIEHRGESVGLAASSVLCSNAPASIDVVINGHVKIDTANVHKGAVKGPTLWSTSRGTLVSGTSAVMSTEQGTYELVIAKDGCVGLIDSVDGGVWVAPDVC